MDSSNNVEEQRQRHLGLFGRNADSDWWQSRQQCIRQLSDSFLHFYIVK